MWQLFGVPAWDPLAMERIDADVLDDYIAHIRALHNAEGGEK